MRRALSLRTRGMPSALSPSRPQTSNAPHYISKITPYRSRSTFQPIPGDTQGHELVSALLHGQERQRETSGQRNPPPIHKMKHPTPSTPKVSSSISQGRNGDRPNQLVKNVKGQKRKAYESLPLPRARRQKPNLPPSANAGYTDDGLPTAKMYPDLPPQIFRSPKDTFNNILQGFAVVSSDFSGIKSSMWHCRLTCSFNDGNEDVVTEAQATTRKAAERAAYLYLAVKCKEHEALRSRLVLLQIDKIDNSIIKEQKDAKMDIYNYAARFDAIPQISEQTLLRSHRTRGRKILEISVKLPAQNIQVTARGADRRSAEIAAALRFKEAAESYQAAHGDHSLVIRDSTSLTTTNSSKFFDFYKIKHPHSVIEVRKDYGEGGAATLKNSDGQHPAQISINGNLIGQAVTMLTKQKAEDLAFLTAAIEVKKQEPTLFPDFVRALAAGNGEILKTVNPVSLTVDEDCQLLMRETLLSARKAGLPNVVEGLVSDEQGASRPKHFRHRLSPRELTERTRYLEHVFKAYQKDPKHIELRRKKEELPMNQCRAQVLDLVSNNSYSIIVGATGSGKTTQVPQIILEDAINRGDGATCNVVCTQPRRIAATSVARRVAVEKAEKLQESVGYHVRFDAKLPQYGGSITYCTTGILLQQLQHQPDEVMDGVSHLVIDEVHERDVQIDFLLILLKKATIERLTAGKSTPKVVLMSATMDTELFASYFQIEVEGTIVKCPSLTVPGRTFPVKEKYLEEIQKELHHAHSPESHRLLQSDRATTDFLNVENDFRRQNPNMPHSSVTGAARTDEFIIDWKSERKLNADGEFVMSTERDDAIIPFGLVATTIAHISKTTDEGAILVFLPGLEELTKVEDFLKMRPLGLDFQDASRFKVHLLHSSIPAAQTEVFNDVARGCRKIILSTNIAETSVTIPDVQYVVDTGKLREKQYDQARRITQLKCTWISKSNSKQRAGRAGRVQNGNYYALFSAERYNTFRAVGLPEMLRTDLQEICLDIKAQAFNYPIRNFLAEALEPPPPQNVNASVLNLQALDALTSEEQITPLGRLLASLPVHPSLGKMIILGVIFRCLDPMLVIGAAAGERNIFISPLDKKRASKEAKHSFVKGSASDHIGLLNAVRELRKIRDTRGEYAMRQRAHDSFIHINAFKTIDNTVRQIEDILVDAGLIPYTSEHARNKSEFGDPSLNQNSSKISLIKALAIAGLHPNLATNTGGMVHRTPGEAFTIIHPSSVNAVARPPKGGRDDGSRPDYGHRPYGTLYTYSAMARSNDGNSVYLRDTTECTPLMAALFGGKLTQSSVKNNVLEMDDWLPFFAKSDGEHNRSGTQIAKTVLEFRNALDRLVAGAFRDLKGRRAKVSEQRGAYLAEDRVTAVFADGLVEVLERDNSIASRGMRSWAGARTFGEYAGGRDR